MSAEEAAAEASRGELVGKGCEAHEEKVRARRERMAEKRKNRAEGKRAAKARRKGRKGAGIETDGHDEHEMMEGQDGEEKSIEMDEEEKYLATAAA
jgi:tRNA-dihydrouridine synthase 1